MSASVALKAKNTPSPGTVGRGKAVTLDSPPTHTHWTDGQVSLHLGDSLNHYAQWDTPTVIVSDGAYGILGFEGDTSDHLGIAAWYEPHIQAWSQHATAQTTLWFWNSEIGWASVHPMLERHGWRYVNANVWNKGKAHIAGNVNTAKIRRFPVVTEMCVQYVFEARLDGINPMTADEWASQRSKFHCPMGFTNVWERNPLKGVERIRVPEISGKAAHLNQKPLDLMGMIIEAASDAGDVVWEPFGGLFSASLAAKRAGRRAFAGEIDPTYFQLGLERFMPRQPEKTVARKREKHSWTDTPGFGMWADREEMADPAAYVRNIRKPRYTL